MSVPGPVIQELFNGRHQSPVAVTLGASPASYQAPSRGYLALIGGTISAITLTRVNTAGTTTTTSISPSSLNIPMSSGDTVNITYSVVPTSSNFIPN